MATFDERLKDDDYRHWVKAVLCLQYTKDGLVSYASRKSQDLHNAVLAQMQQSGNPSANGLCSSASVDYKKRAINCCTNCNAFLVETKKYCSRALNLNNFDIKDLHKEPWQLAKLFMNPGQDATNTIPAQTDLSGILSFVDNCVLAKMSILNFANIIAVRDTRNRVLHTADMKVTKQDFSTKVIPSLIGLLEDPSFLATDPAAQEAVMKIKEVVAADLYITKENERKVLKELATEFRCLNKDLSTKIDDVRTGLNRVETNIGQTIKAQEDKLEKELQDREKDKQTVRSTGVDEPYEPNRLPEEILRMDNKSVELFKKILDDGKERDYNIRIMVVGPFGVGKTTFTKRLLCQDVDINERNSTDGIDVHVGKCKISLQSLDWTFDQAGTADNSALKRLAKVLGRTRTSQNLEDKDSKVADDQEETRQIKRIQLMVKESEKQNRNSAPAITNVSSKALSDIDVAGCLNDIDTMNRQQEQDDLIMKDLKEVVEAGDIGDDSDNATVSVWDFGGQFVFYTTHQIFLSQRAIYILINNLSQHVGDLVMDDDPYFDCSGPQSLRMEDFIDIWLNSIHGHSKNDREPPVLLVGTHTDELSADNREEQIKAMFDAIRNRFVGKEASLHFIDEDFGLSNATEDPKFNELRQKIIEVAKQQSHWGESKPVRWIPVEKLLEGFRRSGVEIISRTKMEELNSKLPVPISSEDELDLFLRFQHEVGNIMYFSLPELRNKIVLSPQFLVNALKSLVTAERFKKKPGVLGLWKEFSQKGILTPNLLDAVWKNTENKSFEENRGHLLALMEHLNIIARPVSYAKNEEAGDCSRTQDQDYFLVPCMLKESPPHSIFHSVEPFVSTPCLCLDLRNIAFPSGIFTRLLCACISRWRVAKTGKKHLLYCGCGQFDVDDAGQHRLTVSFYSNTIGLRIDRYCETDRDPSGTVCKQVYRMVKETLLIIGKGLSIEINYEESVKCPFGEKASFDCLHRVEDVRKSGEFPCHSHGQAKILHSRDMLKYWFDSNETDQELESSEQVQSPHSLPPQILDRVPTDKELSRVSEGIGEEFEQLALELGLSKPSIDQIRESNPNNVTNQIIRSLMKWRQQEGNQATFRELEKAMRSVNTDTNAAFRGIQM